MIKNTIEYYDYQGKLFQETKATIALESQPQQIALYLVERLGLFTRLLPRHKTSGRRAYDYRSLLGIFVMKQMLGMETNIKIRDYLISDATMQRILRLESVPNLSTISSYFREFSLWDMGGVLHKQLVSSLTKEPIMMTISIDSSALRAREARPKRAYKSRKKANKKGIIKQALAKEKKHELKHQKTQTYEQIIGGLTKEADSGAKRGSKGSPEFWHGFKLFAATNNDGIPLAIELTSASLHDTRMGIAMQKRVSEVTNNWLYVLMDKGFSANEIRDYADESGHKAIIDYPLTHHKNPNNQRKLTDFEREIYKNRTDVERFFSDLKDNYGIHKIYVKKHTKVKQIIVFATIALIIKKLFNQEKQQQR